MRTTPLCCSLSAMFNVSRLVTVGALAVIFSGCVRPKASPNAQFEKLSGEYLEKHLAWRPTMGMGLGLHQYDGRLTDFSRASLNAELRRLKRFDEELARFNPQK